MKINFILFCLTVATANIPISTFLAPYTHRGQKFNLWVAKWQNERKPITANGLQWTLAWPVSLKNEEFCGQRGVFCIFCALPSCFFDKKGCGQTTKNSLFFLSF